MLASTMLAIGVVGALNLQHLSYQTMADDDLTVSAQHLTQNCITRLVEHRATINGSLNSPIAQQVIKDCQETALREAQLALTVVNVEAIQRIKIADKKGKMVYRMDFSL